MSSQKLANIQNLHNYIDNTSRTIDQKGDLVENLQDKKSFMIKSIKKSLNKCRNAERVFYNKWSDSSNEKIIDDLNKYNVFLSEKHDEGSVLIGKINVSKNFQQLNRVETTMVNPYLSELADKCISKLRNKYNKGTTITTTGLGKTKVDIVHKNKSIDVNVSKEELLGSPGHNVKISSKGPVRVSHTPSRMVVPVVIVSSTKI